MNHRLNDPSLSFEERLMTVREVADFASLSVSRIWYLAREGIIPKPIKINGATRWLWSEILQFVATAPRVGSDRK